MQGWYSSFREARMIKKHTIVAVSGCNGRRSRMRHYQVYFDPVASSNPHPLNGNHIIRASIPSQNLQTVFRFRTETVVYFAFRHVESDLQLELLEYTYSTTTTNTFLAVSRRKNLSVMNMDMYAMRTRCHTMHAVLQTRLDRRERKSRSEGVPTLYRQFGRDSLALRRYAPVFTMPPSLVIFDADQNNSHFSPRGEILRN